MPPRYTVAMPRRSQQFEPTSQRRPSRADGIDRQIGIGAPDRLSQRDDRSRCIPRGPCRQRDGAGEVLRQRQIDQWPAGAVNEAHVSVMRDADHLRELRRHAAPHRDRSAYGVYRPKHLPRGELAENHYR